MTLCRCTLLTLDYGVRYMINIPPLFSLIRTYFTTGSPGKAAISSRILTAFDEGDYATLLNLWETFIVQPSTDSLSQSLSYELKAAEFLCNLHCAVYPFRSEVIRRVGKSQRDLSVFLSVFLSVSLFLCQAVCVYLSVNPLPPSFPLLMAPIFLPFLTSPDAPETAAKAAARSMTIFKHFFESRGGGVATQGSEFHNYRALYKIAFPPTHPQCKELFVEVITRIHNGQFTCIIFLIPCV